MRDSAVLVNRLTVADRVLAAVLGVTFAAVLFFFSVADIDPALWENTAVIAGLRPPQAALPGLWRIVNCWVYPALGGEWAYRYFAIAGAVVGGACVSLVYFVTRQMMNLRVRIGEDHPVFNYWISPFFSVVAAIFVGVSQPFWWACQTFTPDALMFLLVLWAAHCWFRWFGKGGDFRLYWLVVLVAVIGAENPFGLLLPVFFLLWYYRTWQSVMIGIFQIPEKVRNPRELPKWRMFFLYLAVFGFTVYCNVRVFAHYKGIEVNHWSELDVYFRYAMDYMRILVKSSTLSGWAIGAGFGIMPIVVIGRYFPRLISDEQPMPFHSGAVLFFVGIAAVMQSGAFLGSRFWTFASNTVLVSSNLQLCFYVLLSAIATAMFGTIFAFECQRTYLPPEVPKPTWRLKGIAPAVAVVLVVLACKNACRPDDREVDSIVVDSLRETVRECGGVKFIFTNGALDAGLELMAARENKDLKPLNMMSGPTPWEVAVRTRELEGQDAVHATTGVPILLRVWAGEKQNGLTNSAVQLGFEYWKRERKPLPRLSGLLARPAGMDEKDAERGIEVARELANRINEIASRVSMSTMSPTLVTAFSDVSWRLSRLARLRGDDEIADLLDAGNSVLKRMLRAVEYERQRVFMQLTPREGLEIALRRASFADAKRYAAAVLKSDPDDTDANFGMGMGYFMDGQWVNAEFYLKRCLVRRPDEPAVLNNLSIVCRKLHRYDDAEAYAMHANKSRPGTPEIEKTLKAARERAP